MAAVGAGVAVEPGDEAPREAVRGTIDTSALRAAIEAVLADPEYRRSALRLAEEMRALPPPDAALAAVVGDAARAHTPPGASHRDAPGA